MSQQTSPVGLRPIATAGVTTPTTIDTVKTLTVPTALQRVSGGVLECYITIEGTVTSRYTWNGVTPSSTVGMLLSAPTATSSINLTLVGEALIAAFKIIGTAAGNSMTYQFAVRDTR